MKVNRYKKIRKIMHAYQITHNIKAPFKVALDGEFVQSALAGQIMLKEQLPKLLQEERTTVFVTPCIDNWLRLKGAAYSGALHIASKLDHLKCRHDKGFVRPFECIKHLVANGNPDRLLVGAQDEPIRKLIRHTPGVPLLLIHGSTIVVESPTHTTKEAHAEAIEQQQKVIQKEEAKLVLQAKKELKQDAAAAAASSSSASSSSGAAAGGAASTKKKPLTKPPQKKKRKGPSQPNPLSVKKKKPQPQQQSQKKKPAGGDAAAAGDEQPRKKQKGADGQAAPAAAQASSSPAPAAAASSSSAGSKKRAREETE